jgi:hypothetical protein
MLRREDTARNIYTRDYRVVASTGTVRTRNGILAGQYVQPVTEWVQPELTAPGTPPIPNDFSQMGYLTQGVGPDADGNFWGALNPFPQSGVVTRDPAEECPVIPPTDPQVPIPAISARLRIGSSNTATTDPDTQSIFLRRDDVLLLWGSQIAENFTEADLVYRWGIGEGSSGTASQLATFSGSNIKDATVTFGDNPPVGAYTFALDITSLSYNKTGTDTIQVNLFTGADTITVQSYTWVSRQSGTLSVTCKSSYKLDSRVAMSLDYTTRRGTFAVAMSANPPNSGLWVFSSRDIDQPTSITCRSLIGGSVTATQQVVAKRAKILKV